MREIIFIFIISFFCSCGEFNSSEDKKTDGNDNGGWDGSGGNLIVADLKEVNQVLEKLHVTTSVALFRLTTELTLNSKQIIDQKYGEGSYEVLSRFLKFNKHPYKAVLTAIYKKKINVNLAEDNYCQSKEGHRHGSAVGTFPDGKICISKKSIFKNAGNNVEEQTVALYLHELAHLFGMNEEEAHKVQMIVFKGNNFLFTKPSFQTQILDSFEDIKIKIFELMNKEVKGDSEGQLCQNINQLIENNQRMIGLVSPRGDDLLDRMVPEYIEEDLYQSLNRLKGIRNYCGMYPNSPYEKYNISKGNKDNLKNNIAIMKEFFNYLNNRLTSFFWNGEGGYNNEIFELITTQYNDVVDYDDISSLPYPKECLFMLKKKNESLKKPDGLVGEVILRVSQCFRDNERDSKVYSIPVYWRKGEKLPDGIRGKIEKMFELKILELKIKNKFNDILKYLLGFIVESKYPKLSKLLALTGNTTGDHSNESILIREILIDTFIQSSIGGTSRYQPILLYYAFQKAKEFQVLDQNTNVKDLSEKIYTDLQGFRMYEDKYKYLDVKFNEIQLF